MSNLEQQEMFNAVTDNQMTTSCETDSILAMNDGNGEFNSITNTPLVNFSTPVTPENTELLLETIALVTPENAELLPETVPDTNDTILNTNDTVTPALVGHDTATTTDEEEAAEALLALCNLPDMDDEENGSDDNANLMPIGGPSMSINVNPVEVKLGADDVNQAIEQLPQESRFEASTETSQSTAKGQIVGTDPQTSAQQEDSVPNKPVDSNSPPNSPTKGTLKVKNYGLKNHVKLRELTGVRNVDARNKVYMTSMSTTMHRTHPSCAVTVINCLAYPQPSNYTCMIIKRKRKSHVRHVASYLASRDNLTNIKLCIGPLKLISA